MTIKSKKILSSMFAATMGVGAAVAIPVAMTSCGTKTITARFTKTSYTDPASADVYVDENGNLSVSTSAKPNSELGTITLEDVPTNTTANIDINVLITFGVENFSTTNDFITVKDAETTNEWKLTTNSISPLNSSNYTVGDTAELVIEFKANINDKLSWTSSITVPFVFVNII